MSDTVIGLVAGLAGILLSLDLYRRAKRDTKRAEDAVVTTKQLVEESQAVLGSMMQSLEKASALVEQVNSVQAQVLAVQSITIRSQSVDKFIEELLLNAQGPLTIRSIRESLRDTRWTHNQGQEALDRLELGLMLSGSLTDPDTQVRLRHE